MPKFVEKFRQGKNGSDYDDENDFSYQRKRDMKNKQSKKIKYDDYYQEYGNEKTSHKKAKKYY